MDIRVLKTFLQVAEIKHFGKAAENLYITQAAVSARIKQLEEFYDAQLFIRDKNNLKLTAAGEELLSHAQLMVAQMEESKQALLAAKQQRLAFNIAATPNIWDAFLSSRIQSSIEYLKEVTLGAEISVREAIQRKLTEKNLDIGLLTDPIKDKDYDNRLVGHFELALVGSEKDHTLIEDKYVFVDWGLTFKKEHALHHKLQPCLKTSTAMIALEVILSKGGFAYLPQELVAPYLKSKQLFTIETPLVIKRPIYMVSKSSTHRYRLITQYGDYLAKDMQE